MGLEEKKQTHLMPQDASAVDASTLTALSPEVVSFHMQMKMMNAMLYQSDANVVLISVSLVDCQTIRFE